MKNRGQVNGCHTGFIRRKAGSNSPARNQVSASAATGRKTGALAVPPPAGAPGILDDAARAAIAAAVVQRFRGRRICFFKELAPRRGYKLLWMVWKGSPPSSGKNHQIACAATLAEIQKLERAARAEYQRLLRSQSGYGELEVRR